LAVDLFLKLFSFFLSFVLHCILLYKLYSDILLVKETVAGQRSYCFLLGMEC